MTTTTAVADPATEIIAALSERCRLLEKALGLDDESTQALSHLNLTSAKAKLLGLLMACPGVSVETIESTLGMHDAKVPINRLRNSLRALGFVIHGKRAAGYWIDDETKALIRSGAKVLLEC